MSQSQTSADAIAVGLIVAQDGRLLLQHRDDRPGLVGAGQWGFFGGHLEPYEHPTHAFLREVREELGWQPRHLELYRSFELLREGERVTSYAYAAHLDVPVGSLVLGEGQALALFAPDALPDDAMPSIRPVVAEFASSPVYRRIRRRYDVITATALLVDAGGRFLLQHRDDKPGIANPGRWGSFGGEIEPGETPDEGFLREMREELGWEPSRHELYDAASLRVRGAWQLIYVFAARVDVPFERLTLGEGQDMACFAPDALPASIVPELRTLIERFTLDDAYRALLAPTH